MSHYKPYPEYKDSGVEWIGEVPAHWEVKPFFSVTKEKKVKNTGLQETNRLSLSYGRIIQKSIDLSEGLIPESYETYQIVDEGDIIFRLTDLQNDKRSLRSAICRETGVITSAYLCVIVREGSSQYFNHLMRAYDITKVFYGMGGGLRQSLGFDDLRRLPVICPGETEQSQIATFLNRETTRIDTLVEKKQRFIELLEEKVLAIAMAEQMYGDGELVRFGELIRKASRPANIHLNDEYVALGLYNRGRGVFKKPQVKGKDLGESDFFRVEEGDLIISGQFAWEGAVTMASNNERGCIVSHRYHAIRGESVATEYLLALLMTNFGTFLLDEASRGSAGRNRPLNMNRLLREKIRRPSREAQDSVVRLIKLKALLDLRVKESIELLKERRSALITAAVTGKIDVREEAA